MISILPIAAFGAVNVFGSKVYITDDTAVADGDDELEFDIFVGDEYGAASVSPIYVTTERNKTTSVTDHIYVDTANGSTISGPSAAGVYTVTPASNGWVKVKIQSNLPGAIKFAASIANVSDGANFTVDEFLAGKTNSTAANSHIIISDKGTYAIPVTFTVKSADSVTLTESTTDLVVNANNASYREVKAIVKAGTAPVAGKEVTFTVNKSGATLSSTTATTDAKGEAKVKVFASRDGVYQITAKADGVDASSTLKGSYTPVGGPAPVTTDNLDQVSVYFASVGITDVKAESDNNQKIAKGENVTLKYSFVDSNGYKINAQTPTYSSGKFTNTQLNGAELRVVTKPSGAKIDEKPSATASVDENNLKLVFAASDFDKEGDYSIRFTLANGKSVTYDFNVKKQGTITGLTLKYKSTSIPAGANNVSNTPETKWVDAEGYAKTATGITYSIDNNKIATIDGAGVVKVVGNDTGVVNVTAIDTNKKLVATATINIEKNAASLKLTAPTYNKVGEDAKITVQLVDIDGKPVAGASGQTVTHTAIVLSKPDGAIVNVDTNTTVSDDFNEKGTYTFNVSSNTVGQVKVQAIATVAAGTASTAGKTYTGSGVVNFGDVAAAQKPLTMFIGATNYMVGGQPAVTDAAPFIENGRTYVAVRPIGDALGATIDWDAATQTVTLTKPGEVVTIVIGAATIKVDRAGVVTEYPTDAPAQIKNGRTYLPFRAIGEAMGYEVNYDAATQSVSFK